MRAHLIDAMEEVWAMYRVTLIGRSFPLVLAAILAACSSPDVEYDYPDENAEKYERTQGSLLGQEGFTFFGSAKKVRGDEGGAARDHEIRSAAGLMDSELMPEFKERDAAHQRRRQEWLGQPATVV